MIVKRDQIIQPRKLGAVILAAGKGKRMNVPGINKVTLHLNSKPIIAHIVHFMQKIGIDTIVVVVGHAKESVMKTLEKEEKVIFAEQMEQLGTGHAVQTGLSKLPEDVTDVFVVYGDDAVFYNQKHELVMRDLFRTQLNSENVFTFLTIVQDNPRGLGRIVRDDKGRLLAIVEEKDADEGERKIKEINPGCFVFSVDFLKEYLPKVKRNALTSEYYLTELIELAVKDILRVETVQAGQLAWRGVNTKEELEEAEKLLKQI